MGKTIQKMAGAPFTLPIRWIEGEKGATRRAFGEALGSTVFLPFKLTWEVVKGMLRGGGSVAQLAVHLPWIPFWNKERQDVQLATQRNLNHLGKRVEREHRVAA